MVNRLSEDERNETIIRRLLQLPENRRCINCDSLGPQYVCTNFWTFVCTTCSGIHREYTHRVKSVSMANFSSQEVTALQGGGNQRARELYLKEWDTRRQPLPETRTTERLQDFIMNVYVKRRYTGERSHDKPFGNTKTVEDTFERRYAWRSKSDVRSNEGYSRYIDDKRSPGHDQEYLKYAKHRRSLSCVQVADYITCNRSGSRKYNRLLDREPNLEDRSLNHPKDSSDPPVVHPLLGILREHFPTLRIGEYCKANSGGASDNSARTPRTAYSSRTGSIDWDVLEVNRENSRSLTDSCSHAKPAQQTHRTFFSPQFITEPTSSVTGNKWVTFECFNEENTSQAASCGKTMGSNLSVPAAEPTGDMSTFPVNGILSTEENFSPPLGGGSKDQSWSTSHVSNALKSFSTLNLQSSTKSQDSSSAGVSQFLPSEKESNGRKELMEVPAKLSSQRTSLNISTPSRPTSLSRASSRSFPSSKLLRPHSTPSAAASSPPPRSDTYETPASAYRGQQISSDLPLLQHPESAGFGNDGAVADSIE